MLEIKLTNDPDTGPAEDEQHESEHKAALKSSSADIAALEKTKVKGAIRTDFILSAEIIVISLDVVEKSSFGVKLAVLSAIGILMTGGVYGLVAGIVKLDDLGMWLSKSKGTAKKIGLFILRAAPILMKFLSIAGTAAMFLVGGGILAHKVGFIHHLSEAVFAKLAVLPRFITETTFNFMIGLLCGAVVLLAVQLLRRILPKKASTVAITESAN